MTATAAAPESLSSAVVLTGPIGTTKNLRSMIGERWKMVHALLPAHMTEDRFAALVISAAQKTPKVLACSGESILNAIYQAASLGLEINSATGEAYLLPYKGQAQLVPGYKGLVKLAIRSGEVRAIEARLVYDGEKSFGVFYGTDSRIEHVPDFDVTRNPATVRLAYAVAKLPSGATTFEVMTRKQLDAIWQRSPGKDNGPWISDREEMYRKTVTRRLCKYLPMSPQLAQALELSDEAEEIDARRARSVGSDALNQALKSSPEESEEAEDATPVPVGKKSCPTCLRNDGTHDPDKSCYTDG
jgi:recombination protein RecT